jgi:hypothetical protein
VAAQAKAQGESLVIFEAHLEETIGELAGEALCDAIEEEAMRVATEAAAKAEAEAMLLDLGDIFASIAARSAPALRYTRLPAATRHCIELLWWASNRTIADAKEEETRRIAADRRAAAEAGALRAAMDRALADARAEAESSRPRPTHTQKWAPAAKLRDNLGNDWSTSLPVTPSTSTVGARRRRELQGNWTASLSPPMQFRRLLQSQPAANPYIPVTAPGSEFVGMPTTPIAGTRKWRGTFSGTSTAAPVLTRRPVAAVALRFATVPLSCGHQSRPQPQPVLLLSLKVGEKSSATHAAERLSARDRTLESLGMENGSPASPTQWGWKGLKASFKLGALTGTSPISKSGDGEAAPALNPKKPVPPQATEVNLSLTPRPPKAPPMAAPPPLAATERKRSAADSPTQLHRKTNQQKLQAVNKRIAAFKSPKLSKCLPFPGRKSKTSALDGIHTAIVAKSMANTMRIKQIKTVSAQTDSGRVRENLGQKNELKALKKHWNAMDADGSGSLDRDEIADIMKMMGKVLDKRGLDKVMREVDKDGGGAFRSNLLQTPKAAMHTA